MYKGAKIWFCLSVLLFGSTGVMARNIALPSGALALCRGLIGAAFLVGMCLVTGKKISLSAIRKKLPLLCLGGAVLGLHWLFIFEAYRLTTVTTAILSCYTAPVILVIVSAIFFHEKFSAVKVLCVAAAMAGMVLLSGLLEQAQPGGSHVAGLLFGLLAAVAYVAYTLVNRSLTEIAAHEAAPVQLVVASALMLPYVLFRGELSSIGAIDIKSLGFLLAFGALTTGLGFYLYSLAVPKLPTQTIAVLCYIDPITSVILSALILNERPGAMQLLGGLLILGSAFASEVLGRRAATRVERGAKRPRRFGKRAALAAPESPPGP